MVTLLGAFLYLIPFALLYLIIRIAVRHGIESSDVAGMLREKMKNDNRTK